MAVTVTAEAARRFLVARHFLAPARSLAGGPDAVLDVFRRLGSIQFDPLAVAGRNHDLVLHARVADYDPAWCGALFERREIFEAFNKGLSLVPASEFPWFRGIASRSPQQILAENAEVAERVLDRIRAEGPLSALDFEAERGPTKDWFGMPMNAVRAVLEAHTFTGALGLARRDGNRRYYDLLERLLPADLLARDVPLREQLRYKLLSRYRAHGLLGVSAGDTFGHLGPAKPDPRRPDLPGRDAMREELVALGDLVPVEVEGLRGKRFVVREDVALLEAPPEPPPSVAFLPPFDALIWDRRLLGSLFGFDYVWELFLPPAKRRWGWYVLPITFGDRFVGRIEPRIERADARVDVLDVWWEDGFAPRRAQGFVDAMRDALRAYLRFAGASRLQWASHLASEKRLFLSRP
ncbi:MAG TPA: crosslink repair DNA glycosylase YcaQ family protein [Gaiellaceae bacterium]|nr:crosslink repair DNA glycosylase YcaQ family protein [Gaiellaceae bacterium]